jgi:hypothetical protein
MLASTRERRRPGPSKKLNGEAALECSRWIVPARRARDLHTREFPIQKEAGYHVLVDGCLQADASLTSLPRCGSSRADTGGAG